MLFVHLLPCISLVILNILLFSAIRLRSTEPTGRAPLCLLYGGPFWRDKTKSDDNGNIVNMVDLLEKPNLLKRNSLQYQIILKIYIQEIIL